MNLFLHFTDPSFIWIWHKWSNIPNTLFVCIIFDVTKRSRKLSIPTVSLTTSSNNASGKKWQLSSTLGKREWNVSDFDGPRTSRPDWRRRRPGHHRRNGVTSDDIFNFRTQNEPYLSRAASRRHLFSLLRNLREVKSRLSKQLMHSTPLSSRVHAAQETGLSWTFWKLLLESISSSSCFICSTDHYL